MNVLKKYIRYNKRHKRLFIGSIETYLHLSVFFGHKDTNGEGIKWRLRIDDKFYHSKNF